MMNAAMNSVNTLSSKPRTSVRLVTGNQPRSHVSSRMMRVVRAAAGESIREEATHRRT